MQKKTKNLRYVVSGIAVFTVLSFPKIVSDHYAAKLETLTNSIDNTNSTDIEHKQIENTFKTIKNLKISIENSINSLLVTEEQEPMVVKVQSEEVDLKEEEEKKERNQIALQISEGLDKRIFRYDDSTNTISINGYHIPKDEITDDFYSNLNLLLSYHCDYRLVLSSLGNEIDFSKLDFTNIKELSLDECSDKFDYDIFAHQLYKNLSFFNISVENAIKVTKNTTTSETSIGYCSDSFDDRFQYIKFLVENNININSFYQLGGYNDSDSEIYNLLSNLNARFVSSYECDTKNITSKIDWNLNLNDKIEYFNISFAGQAEVGSINVSSNNPKLNFELFNVLLTENTCFYVPDNTWMYLSGDYSDIHAFDYLSNVGYLNYHDDVSNDNVYWNNDISFDEAIENIEKLHGSSYTKK